MATAVRSFLCSDRTARGQRPGSFPCTLGMTYARSLLSPWRGRWGPPTTAAFCAGALVVDQETEEDVARDGR